MIFFVDKGEGALVRCRDGAFTVDPRVANGGCDSVSHYSQDPQRNGVGMSKTSCRATSSAPLVPPGSSSLKDWGKRTPGFSEGQMLQDFGEAAGHPKYSKPHVSVDRLACAGMQIGLPERFSEARAGVFKQLELSQAEVALSRAFFDRDGFKRPVEQRRIISEALSGLARKPLPVSEVRAEGDRKGALLPSEEVKKLLVLVLRLSAHESSQQLGDELRNMLDGDLIPK